MRHSYWKSRTFYPGPSTLVGALTLIVVLAIVFPWVAAGIVLAALIVGVTEWRKNTSAKIEGARRLLDMCADPSCPPNSVMSPGHTHSRDCIYGRSRRANQD